MLAELEQALIDALKLAPLAQRVRQIDTLPDLNGDSLIGRFHTDAPAVYVALGSFSIRRGYARPKFGIACVTRNSRGQQAARHGDGVAIGLYQLSESVAQLVDGLAVTITGDLDESVSFEVTSIDLVNSEALYQKGVFAAVVQVQTAAELDFRQQLTNLSDFKTFHADYDIDPHQAPAEHDKWLLEPPDHSTSAPELSDPLKLQE